MDQHSELMIFTSEMALDLQQVLSPILATHIVLQMGLAMATVTRDGFWLVTTTASDLLSSKSSILTKMQAQSYPQCNLLDKPSKIEQVT